jgi:hypothetical protein
VNGQTQRASAYADILTGLRDLTDTTALVQFDATLDELVAAGRLSAEDAGRLRYWQREGLRNQADQLITTATTALAGIDAARDEARHATDQAAQTWSERPSATGAASDGAGAEAVIDLDRGTLTVESQTAPSTAAPTPAPPAPAGYVLTPERAADPVSPSPSFYGRHRAAGPSPFDHPGFASAEPGASPGRESDEPATTATAPVADDFADAPARRRRLLVAGLTVIGDRADEPDGDTTTDGQPAAG